VHDKDKEPLLDGEPTEKENGEPSQEKKEPAASAGEVVITLADREKEREALLRSGSMSLDDLLCDLVIYDYLVSLILSLLTVR
jgi:hypothetical protein